VQQSRDGVFGLTERNLTPMIQPIFMNLPLTEDTEAFVAALGSLLVADEALRLLQFLDQIAMTPYEKLQEPKYLALMPPNSQMPLEVWLQDRMPISNLRGARKMLQVSSPTFPAFCDGRSIYGFGHLRKEDGDQLSVEFHFLDSWILYCGKSELLKRTLPEGSSIVSFNEQDFRAVCATIFCSLSEPDVSYLWKLIVSAAAQHLGTNVLISRNASTEVARLASQCTRVKPFLLTGEIMKRVTSIDGTVIIDPSGVCHAVGAILDGNVSERGQRARGGRYNSAFMYLDTIRAPAVIVVVSQDGTIDLVTGKSTMGIV